VAGLANLQKTVFGSNIMGNLDLPKAIVLAGALVAIAIVLVFRYEISSGQLGTFRLNKLTGDVKFCVGGGCE
jgi:hypothetical protein